MRKLFKNIASLSLLAMMAVTASVLASKDNSNKVAKAASTTTNFTLSSESSVTLDRVTVEFDISSGSSAPKWYPAGLRLYANNTVTISSDDSITGITFNWEKQGKKDFATVSANVGSYQHPTEAGEGKWTGSSNSVVFTLGAGQLQLNTFSVTHAASEEIPLTNIGLKSTEEVTVGSTVTLEPIYTPDNATTHKTLSWESSDEKVATVDSKGVVTGVKEGKATITVHATDIDKSASCEVTVKPIPPVPVTHKLKDVYSSSVRFDSTLKFNGVYMGTYGTSAKDGIFFADGEHGVLIYGTSSVPSNWEVGKTVVAVSGTKAFYNGLIQVKNASFEVTSASVDTPVTYNLTGNENSSEVLSRKGAASGTITAVTGQTSGKFVTGTDGKVTLNIGDKDNPKNITLFIKKGVHTDQELNEYSETFKVGNYVAVTGFVNYFKSGQQQSDAYESSYFQLIVPKIASTEKYTASKFATDFLSATDPICASGSYDNLTALQAIWSDVAAKYSLLDVDEKAAFVNPDAEATIKNALARYDYIIGKYNTATVKNLAEFVEGHVVTYSNVDFAVSGIKQNNSIVVIISCISATSILVLALLVIKRRKVNVK